MATGDDPTYDGVFYSRIDKSQWFYQPNHTRVRHRYRGHRESEKVNQELGQIHADISQLSIDVTTAETNLTTYVDAILDGLTYSDITYTDSDATPSNEVLVIESLTEHGRNLSALEERIKRLENG